MNSVSIRPCGYSASTRLSRKPALQPILGLHTSMPAIYYTGAAASIRSAAVYTKVTFKHSLLEHPEIHPQFRSLTLNPPLQTRMTAPFHLSPPIHDSSSDIEKWEFDHILKKSCGMLGDARRKEYYHIRWRGCGLRDDTWAPAERPRAGVQELFEIF